MPRARPRVALACLAALLSLACGDEGKPAPAWTWIDLPGTTCGDGSQTGVALSDGEGDDLVVFLDGGGACWDYLTCFVAETANRGPFGAAQWAGREAALAGTLFDRSDPANPFRTFDLAFVPYCTGDVHGGDQAFDYLDPGGGTRRFHHRGRRNVARALDAIAARFPAPRRLVVAGASAGGFGTLVHHRRFRERFPGAQGVLVDDSGPPLSAISPALLAAWSVAWRLDEALLPLCGTPCLEDLSRAVPALAAAFPDDRIALLSSTRDEVMRSFLLLSPSAFEAGVTALARDRFDALPNGGSFLVAGASHTMLGSPAAFTAGGVSLPEWLRRMVERDARWTPAGP